MTRRPDHLEDERRLAVAPDVGAFCDEEIETLPEPVQRYFRAAVPDGTPLYRSARIAMRGTIKLGTRWLPFRATQLLAPLEGFVWPASVAGGLLRGSDRFVDGAGAMCWKLLGLVPVLRASGPDIDRSAAGRAAGESVWIPTTLLPRFGVRWEAQDPHHLVAHVPVRGEDVDLSLTVDDGGLVRAAHLQRWGDPDGSGAFGLHPFGLEVTGTRSFHDGIVIPAAGRVGWFHGSDRWSSGEFFRFTITGVTPVGGGLRIGNRRAGFVAR